MRTAEEYIASFAGETQERLRALDTLFKSKSGNISAKISWSMPSYIKDGVCFVQVCAFKNHIGLYPGVEAIEHFSAAFAERKLKYSKGGVQLPNGAPLPLPLISEIADYALTHAAQSKPTPRPEKQLPAYLEAKLLQAGLMESYKLRPRYQRTDYISWIERAAREETREKRIRQMTEELRNGDAYMGMAYRAKKGENE